jgi:3-oxoacyl-[acyl-carrier-protein] synthase II
MSEKRTVVTGLGMMSGLGLDVNSSWQGIVAGKNPVRRFSLFDPEGLDCRYGVELPPGAEDLFAEQIRRPRMRRQMTRGTQIAVTTAEMAIADSGLDLDAIDKSRVGVVLGSTGTGYAPPESGKDEHRILRNMSNSPATWVSLRGKFTAPSYVVGTACSSGAYALNAAYSLIQSGACDVVVSGSADSSLNYADVQGFCSLLALADGAGETPSVSSPFDKNRSGFVIAEGGGILVVESLDHARKRGGHIYAEMHRPALYTEAFNVLSPKPDGEGMATSMEMALDAAGLAPTDIDYINAHGTSTRLNDMYETAAIKRVFGTHAGSVAVSSTKSMTGHCLAGAAGLEAVICCKALQTGTIPPTINLTTPDPDLDLDYVPNTARVQSLTHVMSNSFAFGGHNGVNIFSKVD